MLRVGETCDRQTVGSERGGPDDRDTRKAGEDLPVGSAEQAGDFNVEYGDIVLNDVVAVYISCLLYTSPSPRDA